MRGSIYGCGDIIRSFDLFGYGLYDRHVLDQTDFVIRRTAAACLYRSRFYCRIDLYVQGLQVKIRKTKKVKKFKKRLDFS